MVFKAQYELKVRLGFDLLLADEFCSFIFRSIVFLSFFVKLFFGLKNEGMLRFCFVLFFPFFFFPHG